jgi:glycosylphosphatidylinositol transamidase (GPIT) subunit GPI8
MVASAEDHESAIANTTDNDLNVFEQDAFSKAFMEFLYDGTFHAMREVKVSDFPRVFPYERILSHVTLKTTGRPVDKVLFREYFPHTKVEDVLMGKGIDLNQDGTKFYNWEDILQ